jgi:hypothetical protein
MILLASPGPRGKRKLNYSNLSLGLGNGTVVAVSRLDDTFSRG